MRSGKLPPREVPAQNTKEESWKHTDDNNTPEMPIAHQYTLHQIARRCWMQTWDLKYPLKGSKAITLSICIMAIVDTVMFGRDLSEEQLKKTQNLIHEVADCFALLVSKFTQVSGAIHHLNIPENTKFSTKVHQHPLMPLQ